MCTNLFLLLLLLLLFTLPWEVIFLEIAIINIHNRHIQIVDANCRHLYCYIVGLGPNCKFIDLLFKRLVITFIKISFLNCFIVSEIIYSQTDTLTEELMYLR